MLTDAMEDGLKALYVLQREEGAPVGTSALAAYLDVSAPTASNALDSLEERGLVSREKYRGAELTAEGETVALEVLRHHRLLESYLAEALDFDASEVHDEADALEHHISEELEARIADALDEPREDPHGDPIPDERLTPPEEDDTVPLSAAEPGDRVVVARVSDRDEEELAYLEREGVEPGVELDVRERTPVGVLTVVHADGEVGLTEGTADAIRVRPIEEDT